MRAVNTDLVGQDSDGEKSVNVEGSNSEGVASHIWEMDNPLQVGPEW